jgi:hypothetical protein
LCAVQVSCLDDDGLLSEFTALQMLALYNVNPCQAGGAADTNSVLDTDDARQTRDQILTDCKQMDEELEEFMMQQVANQAWQAQVFQAHISGVGANPKP